MNTDIPNFSEDPLGDWYEQYHKLVRHHIQGNPRLSNCSENELDDLTSEVFRRVRRKLVGGGKPILNPKSYLMRAADTVCIDASKATKLRTVSFYKVNDEEQAYLDSLECDESEQPEILVEKRALLAEAVLYLDELSPDQREPIQLLYLKGWNYTQIAEKMKISRSTVKSRVHKGIEQLRVRLLHDDL